MAIPGEQLLLKMARKRFDDPEQRRLASEAAKRRFSDPRERARLSKAKKQAAGPVKLRFWNKVAVRTADECWEWLANRDKDGYGMMTVDKRCIRSTRLLWEWENGPIPKGAQVCHSCNNPSCVNRDHLSLGSNKQNNEYKVACGRQASGEKNGNSKLTAPMVLAIRAEYVRGVVGYSTLAGKYGVSGTMIRDIVLRKNWGHI